MTTNEITTENQPDPWTPQLAALKTRYPHVRDAILVALHILIQNPDIGLDDAKAQAALRGVRITAASVAAARRLLSRMEGAADPTPAVTTPATEPAPKSRRQRPATASAMDAESLLRSVVAEIQSQAEAEARNLREAIRRAVGILEAALGS